MTTELIQGSAEWLEIRLGKITASRFSDCLPQPKTIKAREAGELSDTAKSYAYEVYAEILTGQQKVVTGRALEWGSEHESEACAAYEDSAFVVVDHVGFVEHEIDTLIGGSPDGLIGKKGMIEIKCPYNSANHARTLSEGMPKAHMAQIQGLMWITGREWCDFISYDPRVKDSRKLYIQRINRDGAYIEDLAAKVYRVVDRLRLLAS